MADQPQVAPPPELQATAGSAPDAGRAPAPSPRQAEKPRKKMSARTRGLLILGLIMLAIAGFFVWWHVSRYEDTDDAQIDGHIHPISARINGYVIDVSVNDNQFVQQGTVLVKIDPRDYQVAVDKAKADLADAQAKAVAAGLNVPITSVNTTSGETTAQADIENANAGIQSAQEQANSAAASQKEAEANDWKAQNDLQRYAQLVQKKEISQQQYDQAVASAKSSAAAVAAAKAATAAANQQVTQAQSKLVQANASYRQSLTGPQQVATMRSEAQSALAAVQQKQAALDQAELNLQYATVTAPVSGVVYRKVEIGQNVQPGQELMDVVPVDELYVTANFKETQLENMQVGQRAVVHVDSYGRDYDGRVDSVAGASGASFSLLPPENATGNYVKVVQRIPVKIVLNPGQDSDHLLRIGMSVEPKVYVK